MDNSMYGPFLVRIGLGLLFLIAGLGKLMDPSGIIGMLGGMGFPAPIFFGWLLLAVEILCGLALLAGWQTKYAVWPLAIVLLVALIAVYVPQLGTPMGPLNALWHVLGILGLVSLYFTGPGAWAVDKA